MPEEEKEENRSERIIVNDRRLLTDDERQGIATDTGESEPEGPTASPHPDTEESELFEKMEGEEGPAQDVDVPTLVQVFIAELGARSWMHLGLLQNPITKLVVKDLPQARLAIDCVAALIENLDPSLEPRERQEYQTLLRDLRMNFVQHSGS
ncbi:MAG: DUF1844 domain-containing protein [Armatimonadetes bacterium]|nr:DUF1844 domain-containing protein [Armatimonadota bacterium]